MSTFNNFTRPAEGEPAIELSVFRDTEFAKDVFDDNIQPLVHLGGGNAFRLSLYTDSKSVPVPERVSDIISMSDLSVKTVVEIARRFEHSSIRELLKEYPTIEELRNFVANLLLEDLFELDYIWLVELPASKFGVKSILGYSDNEVYNIIYAKDHEPSRDQLKKVFWKAPACCELTVDGEEFQLAGDYEYDREAIIAAYTGPHAEYVKSWLRDNLPERLGYE